VVGVTSRGGCQRYYGCAQRLVGGCHHEVRRAGSCGRVWWFRRIVGSQVVGVWWSGVGAAPGGLWAGLGLVLRLVVGQVAGLLAGRPAALVPVATVGPRMG